VAERIRALRKELAEAQAEIQSLTIRLNDVLFLLKKEMSMTSILRPPTDVSLPKSRQIRPGQTDGSTVAGSGGEAPGRPN